MKFFNWINTYEIKIESKMVNMLIGIFRISYILRNYCQLYLTKFLRLHVGSNDKCQQ